jgi:uncharacterized radical SAM superfamily Fe-S cluster-containing enzyme
MSAGVLRENMTIEEVIKVVVVMTVLIGVPSLVIAGFVLGVIRRRRERRELRHRINDAIKKITADGKVEGPKGKYKPMRWARRWLDFTNSLPMPRRRYEMSGGKMPHIERRDR